MQQHQIALGLTLLLFATAFGLDYYFSKNTNLAYYADRIDAHVAAQNARIDSLLHDADYLERRFAPADAYSFEQINRDVERLYSLAEAPFNFSLYSGDSLIFWTSNNAFLDARQLAELRYHPDAPPRLLTLDNGRYLVQAHPLPAAPDGESRLAVRLIEIYRQYALNSPYLQNRFALPEAVPHQVQLSDVPTPVALHADGHTYGHLRATGTFHDARQRRILLSVFILAFITLGIAVNQTAQLLVRRYRRWVGAAFLITTVFSLRLANEYFHWTDGFADIPLFAQTFTTPVLQSSLGDLLIDIVLLLWMMVFFNRIFIIPNTLKMRRSRALLFTGLHYFAVIFGVIMTTAVFKSLVVSSGIVFDFENVFLFNFYSILAILGIILLLFALFLFSHRMIATVRKIGLDDKHRLLALGGALALAVPVLLQVDLLVPPYILLLICLIYCSMFDFSLDRRTNLTGVIIWITFFAMFSSGMLFKYNRHRDLDTRRAYAVKLAESRDTDAETDLQTLHGLLADTDSLHRRPPDTLTERYHQRLALAVATYYNDLRYLSTNYRLDTRVFAPGDTGTAAYTEWRERWQNSRATTAAGLHLDEQHNGYLLRVPFGETDAVDPTIAFVSVERHKSNTSRVYTELLLQQHYKQLDNLKDYDYAVYRNGVIQDQDEESYPERVRRDLLPPVGQSAEIFLTAQKSVLAYHHTDGTVVLMGKHLGGYIQPLRLFSYMFTLLMITFILLWGLNYFFNVLPNSLTRGLMMNTLRNRIQLWIILLEMATFIMIGIGTVIFFKKNSINYHDGRLDRKISSIVKDAEHETELYLRLNRGTLDLGEFVQPFSSIHRMDVNIFDLAGNLVSSSDEDIFNKGIIAPKMNAYAYQMLAGGGGQTIKDERIGELSYRAAYVPLNQSDGRLIAYLELPYYSKTRKTNDEIREFMGNLLNAYVFLLIIAVGVAFFVAETITDPIRAIGNKLKHLQLGKNEPLDIDWNKEDEIGQLIAVYNQMIVTLDDNTRKLKHSKKLEAYQEMAKKVAHEINNPLTPIKMSAQMLQFRYRQDPSAIAPVLDRTCSAIVEQVNTISNIVANFRTYGTLGESVKEDFEIGKLVDRVFFLATQELRDVDLKLDLSADLNFVVHADREQLMRVLNNLLKNAVQAMNPDRRGEIRTRLYEQRGYVIIAVQDNGTGIPLEKQDKVFDEHFTTKGTGSGLGLSMSKGIVEDARGRLYFETTPGVGTTFFVELPIVRLAEAEDTPGPGKRS